MKTAAIPAFLMFLTLVPGGGDTAPAPPGVRIVGSDSMVLLETALAEAIQKNVTASVTGGGSAVGINALKANQTGIASSTRAMKPAEKEAIEKDGRKVTEVRIGCDALAICVHKDNALKSITIEQLRGVWVEDGKNLQWSDLGKGLPPNLIELYSLPATSAVTAALPGLLGAATKPLLKPEIEECANAAEILQHLAEEPHAMGCVRFSDVNDKVKVLAISVSQDIPAVTLSAKTAAGETWPLRQPLYLYTTHPDAPGVKAFLDFVQSKKGREIIAKQGFVAPQEAKK